MTSFSVRVLAASLFALVGLLIYTFWLMRKGRLSAHLTVRWMLAEVGAILAVLLWSVLPFFSYTSDLADRELLVILAVLSFAFMVLLMLDSLARISSHTHQIKCLTQEVALLRERVPAAGESIDMLVVPAADRAAAKPPRTGNGRSIAYTWIFICIALFVLEMQPGNLVFLKPYLTAAYRQ